MHGAPPDVEHHRAALLARQGLSAEDVVAMRAGRMCPGALRALGSGMTSAFILLGVGPVLSALGVGLSMAVVALDPASAFEIAGVLAAWPAILVVAGIITSALGVLGVFGARASRRRAIVVLEGPTRRAVGAQGRRILSVGGVNFYERHERVVREVSEHLTVPAPVRLFLTEHDGLTSGVVVGVEPLPAPPVTAARCTWYRGQTPGQGPFG